jgi:transposase-like protein
VTKIKYMGCQRCGSKDVVKRGMNSSGSQRYLCKSCRRHFTPEPNSIGYGVEVRGEAVAMYVDGHNYRRAGRDLRVNHQSVANWVKAAAELAAAAPVPRPQVDEDTVVELDELFTFVENKKRNLCRHASPPGNTLFHELVGGHSARS